MSVYTYPVVDLQGPTGPTGPNGGPTGATGPIGPTGAISDTVPLNVASPGIPGQLAYDNTYLYVCVATNTWRRTPLSSW